MEDSIRQGVTILTQDNTNGFNIGGWSFIVGSGVAPYEEVKVGFSIPFGDYPYELPPSPCDGLVYEVSRVGDTIWIAFFLTMESTQSGWYARWGGDGPVTQASIGDWSTDDLKCDIVYAADGGKTMSYYIPMGSFDAGDYTVITNLGVLGYTDTLYWQLF